MEGECRRQVANVSFCQLKRPLKSSLHRSPLSFLFPLKELNGDCGMENCGSDPSPQSTRVTFESASTEAPGQLQKGKSSLEESSEGLKIETAVPGTRPLVMTSRDTAAKNYGGVKAIHV